MRTVSRGFSLIEMMVALTIGTFLVIGVTQIYLDNKRSFLFQQGQTGNRNNALLTLELLDRQLARTGFRANPLNQTNLASAFPAIGAAVTDSDGVACPTFSAGATFKATGDSATKPSGICLRYQGALDGIDQDCLGNAIASVNASTGGNVLIKLRYAAGSTPGTGSVTCSSWRESNGSLTKLGTSTLVQGLTDFRWFAVPVASAASPAIRYAALLSTTDAVRAGMTSTVASNWQTLTGQQVTDQGQALQIVQSTVLLRNLAP